MSGGKGLGLDATVFVFWSEEGILAGFRLEPGARGAPGEGGAQLFAAVDASVAVYKCEPGAPHPTPIYMPPAFMSEFLQSADGILQGLNSSPSFGWTIG